MQNDETKENDTKKTKNWFVKMGVRYWRRLDQLDTVLSRLEDRQWLGLQVDCWKIDLVKRLKTYESETTQTYGICVKDVDKWARNYGTEKPTRKARLDFLTKDLGFRYGDLSIDGSKRRVFYRGTLDIDNVRDHLIDLCAV